MENQTKPKSGGKFLEYLSAEILKYLVYPELEVLVYDKPDLRFPTFGVEHTIVGEILYCTLERAVNSLSLGSDVEDLKEETVELINKTHLPGIQLNYEILTDFSKIKRLLISSIQRKNEKIERYKHYNASVDLFIHLLYPHKDADEMRELISVAQKERGKFRKIYILFKNDLVTAEKKRVTHHTFSPDEYDYLSTLSVKEMQKHLFY